MAPPESFETIKGEINLNDILITESLIKKQIVYDFPAMTLFAILLRFYCFFSFPVLKCSAPMFQNLVGVCLWSWSSLDNGYLSRKNYVLKLMLQIQISLIHCNTI